MPPPRPLHDSVGNHNYHDDPSAPSNENISAVQAPSLFEFSALKIKPLQGWGRRERKMAGRCVPCPAGVFVVVPRFFITGLGRNVS